MVVVVGVWGWNEWSFHILILKTSNFVGTCACFYVYDENDLNFKTTLALQTNAFYLLRYINMFGALSGERIAMSMQQK